MNPEDIKCWDSTVKIGKVEGNRHYPIFPEDGTQSRLSFCNRCGSPFVDDNDACWECGLEKARE